MITAGLSAYETGVQDLCWAIAPPDKEDEQSVSDRLNLPTITTGADLDAFLWDYFQVRLPNKRCCKGHRTPHEAFHHAYFAESPISIWKASRGFGGKSFTLALLALTEALTLRADVNILGGTGEQSKRVLEAITRLWEVPTAPRAALTTEPGGQKQKLIWHNRIVALMASQASVRGPHPQRLRMDEVDEMKIGILDSALGQPMSKGWVKLQVVLSSTHQYPDGTMSEMLKRAGINHWPVFEWCYRENMEPHGWLGQAEVDMKRAILTARMWDTEIELQEPSSEGRAIDTEAVEARFRTDLVLEPPVGPELVNGELKQVAKYSHGADWAKKKDRTVIVTIRKDCRPMRVVAIHTVNREPWPLMASYLDERVAAYGGTSIHDNTGLGQVVHDLLRHESEAFNMIGRDRADLLSEYVKAIEAAELEWPRDETNPHLELAYSEHKYATQDDLYKSGEGHLPDTIAAAALAFRAASKAEAASSQKPPDPAHTPHLNRMKQIADQMRAKQQVGRPAVASASDTLLTQPDPVVERPVVNRLGWRRPKPRTEGPASK